MSRARRVADDQVAYRYWAAGLMVPHNITVALDAQGLYGPEVDVACGAEEPDVDRWEAGELYPTWEQVLALAELTGKTPRIFMEPSAWTLAPAWTSPRFHVSPSALDSSPPVLRFKPEAVAAMKEAQP